MFKTRVELDATLEHIRDSPRDTGVVEKIVCRPDVNERLELQQAQLDPTKGLVGDNWLRKGYRKTPDGSAHPDMQLTLMNARAIAVIATREDRWQLAGDQFFVDFDLSHENLPPGTQLQLGGAIIEVTAEPHLGCSKFAERYGNDAKLFVNSELGKTLNLRGINAKVIGAGKVLTGDAISKPAP